MRCKISIESRLIERPKGIDYSVMDWVVGLSIAGGGIEPTRWMPIDRLSVKVLRQIGLTELEIIRLPAMAEEFESDVRNALLMPGNDGIFLCGEMISHRSDFEV